MTQIRILIPAENFETTATLLQDEAPQTCDAILRSLPLQGNMLHAMMSGNETFLVLEGEKMLRLEPENWTFKVIPGDILFWYSHWGEGKYLKDNPEFAEIVFIYGRHVQLRDLSHREAAGNLFATLDAKLSEFAKICSRIRVEGAKKILLKRV
jgi:hypothetical protein